jgi:hypothetical protein
MNLGFLRAWQRRFPVEGFAFDYHLWWDSYKDPGQWASAKVLHRDIQGLKGIGLDGYVGPAVNRIGFPSGLGMAVLGATLWDRRASFSALVEDHYRAAFGEGGEFVRKYMQTLSRLFAPPVLRGEGTPADRQAALRGWRKIPALADQAEAAITKGLQTPDKCHAHSWRLLREFGDMVRLISQALVKKEEASPEEAKAAARQVLDWVRRRERKLHHVLDLFEFVEIVGRYIGLEVEEFDK